MQVRFILIDDDPISNMVSARLIRAASEDFSVSSFHDPELGLRHIGEECRNTDAGVTHIVLLDLHMAKMSAWTLIEQALRSDDRIFERAKLYILLASIQHSDITAANNNAAVRGYLEKPLTRTVIMRIVGNGIGDGETPLHAMA